MSGEATYARDGKTAKSTCAGRDGACFRFGVPSACAPSRAKARDPKDLIRFALSPDGIIVPDLDRRLPGRGVWIGCDRRLVENAVATHAFSKSLKVKAEAPADLAERVDDLIVKRVAGTLSLANKAGLAIAGFDRFFAALAKGPVRVVLHGTDAALDGRSKIDRKYKQFRPAGVCQQQSSMF